MIEVGDIFIQFYLYYVVFFQCVYGVGFCFVWFDKVQWFWDWYLEDNDLIFGQWCFGDVVMCLDKCCIVCMFSGVYFGYVFKEVVN